LGEKLFNSPALSASGQIACASCHSRELGWGDGLRTSFGHNRQRGHRNAQSLFTAAWQQSLFWDGRSPTLEHQAMMPVVNPVEMAGSRGRIEQRLNRDRTLRAEFANAYGVRRIRLEDTAMALAVFQRSIRPRSSKWDRVVGGEGGAILTDQERLGLHLFQTKAGCASCHSGPLLTDHRFHNLGLTFFGRSLEDRGRYLVTGNPADIGRFRTPSLRSVRHTAPYMHNGIVPHLEGVVNFYNGAGGQPRRVGAGASDPLFPETSPMMRPLGLTRDERAAIVAFLETL
jgi:cytochrome c peroxidase